MQVYGATRNKETEMCKWNCCGGRLAWCRRKTELGRAFKKIRRKTARFKAKEDIKEDVTNK